MQLDGVRRAAAVDVDDSDAERPADQVQRHADFERIPVRRLLPRADDSAVVGLARLEAIGARLLSAERARRRRRQQPPTRGARLGRDHDAVAVRRLPGLPLIDEVAIRDADEEIDEPAIGAGPDAMLAADRETRIVRRCSNDRRGRRRARARARAPSHRRCRRRVAGRNRAARRAPRFAPRAPSRRWPRAPAAIARGPRAAPSPSPARSGSPSTAARASAGATASNCSRSDTGVGRQRSPVITSGTRPSPLKVQRIWILPRVERHLAVDLVRQRVLGALHERQQARQRRNDFAAELERHASAGRALRSSSAPMPPSMIPSSARRSLNSMPLIFSGSVFMLSTTTARHGNAARRRPTEAARGSAP